jgi:hypothetical protein
MSLWGVGKYQVMPQACTVAQQASKFEHLFETAEWPDSLLHPNHQRCPFASNLYVKIATRPCHCFYL